MSRSGEGAREPGRRPQAEAERRGPEAQEWREVVHRHATSDLDWPPPQWRGSEEVWDGRVEHA